MRKAMDRIIGRGVPGDSGRRSVMFGVAWALLLVLTGCRSSAEDVLRVGTNVWPGYETLYLARGLGYYDGTQVRLVELPSATGVMEAFRSGRLEAAALTLDEALSLMSDGFKLKAILIFDRSRGGDAVLAKPGITSLAELRGRRIAAEKSAVGGLVLQSALDAAGLAIADVRLVNCDSLTIAECYETSDAIVTFEPAKTLLLEEGAHVLWDSGHVPGRIVDVLVVTRAAAESRPDGVRALLSGYFAAQKYFSEHREDAIRRMAVREHVSAEQFDNSLSGLGMLNLQDNREFLEGSPAPLDQTACKTAAYMRSRRMLTGAVKCHDFALPRFLPEETQ